MVEQAARNRSGWLLPFNGTGGIWRRQCIDEAGGWCADTLTEDLDLSYRAQMAGWRSLFLPDVEAPGEIPPQLAAYKQQQARWASGNTQCLRKLLRPLLGARLSLGQKVMAVQHLCQYLPQPLMLALLLLTPPLLLADALRGLPLAPLGALALAPPLMYAAGQIRLYERPWRGLSAFPALLLLGSGMSLSNSLAVFSALLGRRSAFRRTPKFAGDWAGSGYALSLSPSLLLEAGVYAVCAVGGLAGLGHPARAGAMAAGLCAVLRRGGRLEPAGVAAGVAGAEAVSPRFARQESPGGVSLRRTIATLY